MENKEVSFSVLYGALYDASKPYAEEAERNGNEIRFLTINKMEEPIRVGIKFNIIGVMTPEKASEYGNLIRRAAGAASRFRYNGYMLK